MDSYMGAGNMGDRYPKCGSVKIRDDLTHALFESAVCNKGYKS